MYIYWWTNCTTCILYPAVAKVDTHNLDQPNFCKIAIHYKRLASLCCLAEWGRIFQIFGSGYDSCDGAQILLTNASLDPQSLEDKRADFVDMQD